MEQGNCMMELDLGSPADGNLGISPQREMGAYEALWDEDGATFKPSQKSSTSVLIPSLRTLWSRSGLRNIEMSFSR